MEMKLETQGKKIKAKMKANCIANITYIMISNKGNSTINEITWAKRRNLTSICMPKLLLLRFKSEGLTCDPSELLISLSH